MELGVIEAGWGVIRPVAQELAGLMNLVFYSQINDFLRDEIAEFQDNLVGRMMVILGAASMLLLTAWITVQGWRIVTGRSRESMMALVVDALRATLVIAVATGFAAANSEVYDTLTEDLGSVIVGVITDGADVNTLYRDIDRSLALMNLALGSVEAVQIQDDSDAGAEAEATRTRNLYFAGFGTGGPAITAGVMLTLNKVALSLFVGFGPLFVLCLLFNQTRSLFQRWLLYGIGTWFSLAVLFVMVTLATDLTLAVGAALWVGKMLDLAGAQGLNSMAIQQAGLGVILTMLLITTPGMAAAFFQGTLGQFVHYSVFDQKNRNEPSAQGPAGAPTGWSAPASSGPAQRPTPAANDPMTYGAGAPPSFAATDAVKPERREKGVA